MKQANIIWFEIPVINLDRAISFYSHLLHISINRIRLYQTDYGIFNRTDTAIGGSLVVKPEYVGKGTNLFFHVRVLSDAIDTALQYGGKQVKAKTLLKQIDENGKTILAQNLIDNQVGYYAEILDSEGNTLCLYSHY